LVLDLVSDLLRLAVVGLSCASKKQFAEDTRVLLWVKFMYMNNNICAYICARHTHLLGTDLATHLGLAVGRVELVVAVESAIAVVHNATGATLAFFEAVLAVEVVAELMGDGLVGKTRMRECVCVCVYVREKVWMCVCE
jgi:hypothetical protein